MHDDASFIDFDDLTLVTFPSPGGSATSVLVVAVSEGWLVEISGPAGFLGVLPPQTGRRGRLADVDLDLRAVNLVRVTPWRALSTAFAFCADVATQVVACEP